MKITRPYPLCLRVKSKLSYDQKFVSHFQHNIVTCSFCGFMYVNNTPDQRFYDKYYKNQSKYEGTRQHEMHEDFTYKTLGGILKKYIPNKSIKILEIGCSTGKLLNCIKSKGYKNVLGIEPAPKCKEIAKKKYDISIITSTLEKFKTNEKFDLLIISEVLEHLIDPREATLRCYTLLKSGGLLYIGVPDAGQFYNKFKEPFGEFSTEHINFFTDKSLTQLGSLFETEMIKSDSRTLLSLWKKEDPNSTSMNRYIQLSKSKMNSVSRTIRSLPKKCIVWGVGALTQRLLKNTHFIKKIFLFVDNNENLIGKKVEGIQVVAPQDLYKYNNPIFISSFGFKDEILEELKRMKIKNKVITFE